jgi:hypothetical protein
MGAQVFTMPSHDDTVDIASNQEVGCASYEPLEEEPVETSELELKVELVLPVEGLREMKQGMKEEQVEPLPEEPKHLEEVSIHMHIIFSLYYTYICL